MSNEGDCIKKKIEETIDSIGQVPKRTIVRRDVSVRMSDGKVVVTDYDSDDAAVMTQTMSYAAAKDHVAQLQNAIATIDAAIAAGVVKVVEKG
jgi:hypothetical protein